MSQDQDQEKEMEKGQEPDLQGKPLPHHQDKKSGINPGAAATTESAATARVTATAAATPVPAPTPAAPGATTRRRTSTRATTTEDSSVSKPSVLQKIWKILGLNPGILVVMIKGVLPPILILACCQVDSFANIYTTLGYLTAIMSLLSLPFLPRARFIQAMFYSVLFMCLASALGLLNILCVVSARNSSMPHTATGSSSEVAYSASANTTSAVFLFVLIYLISLVRAYRRSLTIPSIQFMIFAIIIATYAPKMPSMAIGMAFVRRLLFVCLTGFAFATGVNFFIFPVTSRSVANKEIAGVLHLIQGAISAHSDYISAIPHAQDYLSKDANGAGSSNANIARTASKANMHDQGAELLRAKADVLKHNISAIGAMVSKLKGDMGFAKKEFGYGKIGPKEYPQILIQLTNIMLPVVGMSTLIGIMETIGRQEALGDLHSEQAESEEMYQALRSLETDEWAEAISPSKKAYNNLRALLLQAINHIGLVLGVFPKPKTKKGSGQADIEKDGGSECQPGDKEFSKKVKAGLEAFHSHRETAILRWCEKRKIDLPETFWDNPNVPFSLKDNPQVADSARKAHKQHQLYILLYTEYLVFSIGRSIFETVEYVDRKYADGTLAKNRLIFPTSKQMRKLILKAVTDDDSDNDVITDGDSQGLNVKVGDSLSGWKKDPEHLPPTTWFQKATDPLRRIPHLLARDESAFAFRTTVATISIGILAFLRQTTDFFNEQRGIWALIMVSLSMDSHAGRGMAGFFLRTFGTAIAMVASIVIWYIGDGHAAAIIPVFFIYLLGCMWFLVKNPSMVTVAIISMVTVVLMIGYELQDEKLGQQVTEMNGQEYYKIYLLAPFRLVTVVIGLGTAAFWTFVPYPVTTHATLRNDLGKALYLLANYYSCAHTTISHRLSSGSMAAEGVRGRPLYRLVKARNKVFAKVVTVLSSLRQTADFSKWEPTFGGRFPLEIYTELIDRSQHIFNYTSLMLFCSVAFTESGSSSSSGSSGTANGSPVKQDDGTGKENDDIRRSEWLHGFAKVTGELRTVDHDLTSRLCLLSASLTNKQPLPPYLSMTRSANLTKSITHVDPEILSVQHIREPCYAAFAVLEVSTTLLRQEVESVSDLVRQLVGEVDFSFHVISTTDGDTTVGAGHPAGQAYGNGNSNGSTLVDNGRTKVNKQD